jgi:hypothetical protein
MALLALILAQSASCVEHLAWGRWAVRHGIELAKLEGLVVSRKGSELFKR